jgi:5-methylcytosine-specific restriction endonuclease McrA
VRRKRSRWRLRVLYRDAWTCQYCKHPAWTVDHVVPLSRGGADDPVNMVAACERCNNQKRDREPTKAEIAALAVAAARGVR